MRTGLVHLTAVISLLIPISVNCWGQEGSSDFDVIEAEIQKPLAKPMPAKANAPQSEKVESVSDLGRLAPFSEVSVLQRRYMPKSNRWQFFSGLAATLNDPWFWGMGLSARVAYGLTEKWGVEAVGTFLSTSEKAAAGSLLSEHGVDARALVAAKGYTGADLMWTPIYGKLSLFNQKIIHFDMYFSFGGGTSSLVNSLSTSASTMHFGTGQIFSLSKSLGLRWDLSINSYAAKSQTGSDGKFNNVLLTVGTSYYIPEVSYR